jgi:hypothetical protein
MKMLNRCNQHPGCRVDFDGEWCPLCTADNLFTDYARTTGRLRKENNSLKERVAKLEELLVCTTCGEFGGGGKLICSVCNGLDDAAPRESAAGYGRTTCGQCDQGMVPCPDCGEEADRE